ncbi:MAG: tetratricopeptide repeat protein [Myxococcales bacterium]|nr:tetratricopeptide repeat protein [Myxococcales bacterium]
MPHRHLRKRARARGGIEERFADALEHHRAGRLERAAAGYEQVLHDRPEHAPALSMIGVLALQRGTPERAVPPLLRATVLDPEQPGYFLNLGNALRGTERLGEAEQAYRKALQLEPGMAIAHNNLGNVLRDRGLLHEAALAYREALRLSPELFAAAANLAQVLARLDDTPRQEVLVAHERALAIAERAGLRTTDVANALNARAGLLLAAGEDEAAVACLREAIAIDPSFVEAHLNLAHAHARALRLELAVEPLRAAIALRPDELGPYRRLAMVLRRLQRNDEAHEVYQAWHARDPDDPIAAHMANVGDADPPERASDDYLTREFDGFAESFESVLLDELDYQGPRLVAAALQRTGLAERRGMEVLDAGCGTGLCAGLLRPLAARLTGVDLSGKMLAKARARGSYDALVEAELGAFLLAHPHRFDLVVAGGVLLYFGRLDELARALGGALRPGGGVVLTVEAGHDAERGWSLSDSGRYAHHPSYLRRVLHDAGLRQVEMIEDQLHLELGEPVMAWVVTATRPAPRGG